MQANPLCLRRLDDCLVRIHRSTDRQCENTSRMRMLLRLIFADGRVDAADITALMHLRAHVEAEHNHNLEADALVEDGQEHLTATEDLLHRWAEAAKRRAARQSGSGKRTASSLTR